MEKAKYGELIAKIEKKRRWAIALTIVAILLTLFFTTPIEVTILEKEYLLSKGLSPFATIVLILICFFAGVMAYAIVSSPLNTSMDLEANPEKHLVLNIFLNKQNIENVYSTDYLYLGDYAQSLKYSQMLLGKSKPELVLVGLFNIARCEFLLGNYDSFREAAKQYENKLAVSKFRPKVKILYEKINAVLTLMCAISQEDTEKIDKLRNTLDFWCNSKASQGFVNYVKALAAYKVNDKEEAIYRFKSVKDFCSQTVFATLSEEYLALLRQ